MYGAPPVDFLPQQNPKSVQKLAEQAQSFIKDRLLPMLGDMQPEPVVHVVKVQQKMLCCVFNPFVTYLRKNLNPPLWCCSQSWIQTR